MPWTWEAAIATWGICRSSAGMLRRQLTAYDQSINVLRSLAEKEHLSLAREYLCNAYEGRRSRRSS